MTTLQQYIDESSAGLSHCHSWDGGMNIQLYHCGLIKFCNESNIETVEELIFNVDINKIVDFPYWSWALELTTHDKILASAYEYIRPGLKSNIKCVLINWERVATQWLKLLDGDTVTEQQALFSLFALPAIKPLDETNLVRIAWEKRLEEIWVNHKPNLPSSSKAPVTYTPDSSKYDR